MDKGGWWATVHGVTKMWTQMSDCTHTHTHTHTCVHVHTCIYMYMYIYMCVCMHIYNHHNISANF